MGLEPIPKKDLFLRQACLPVPPSEYINYEIEYYLFEIKLYVIKIRYFNSCLQKILCL